MNCWLRYTFGWRVNYEFYKKKKGEIGGKFFSKISEGKKNFRLVPFSDTGHDPKTEIEEIGGKKIFPKNFWGRKKKFPVSTIFGHRSCSKNRNRRDSGKKFLKNFWGKNIFG